MPSWIQRTRIWALANPDPNLPASLPPGAIFNGEAHGVETPGAPTPTPWVATPAWSSGTVYNAGDNVTYGGLVYTAAATSQGATPGTDPTSWNVVPNVWSAGSYVSYGGTNYTAIVGTTSVVPGTDGTVWQVGWGGMPQYPVYTFDACCAIPVVAAAFNVTFT